MKQRKGIKKLGLSFAGGFVWHSRLAREAVAEADDAPEASCLEGRLPRGQKI